MRSTINLDDNLMERAKSLTSTKETAALVRQAPETLVRVESGKRLIALGGTMPEAEVAPRRRTAALYPSANIPHLDIHRGAFER